MARWQLLAGPAVGAPSVDLTKATGRKVSWKLTDPSSLSFSIDGRHPQAAEINELATDVHLLRDGVPVYTGRVGPTRDTLDGTAHKVDVTTSDTRALLARRVWHADADTAYVGVEQATLVADLIANAQARTGGDLGITADLAPTGALTTRTVVVGASILDELTWLATVGDPTQSANPGFDWDISAGWTGRTLQLWYPQRGESRGVILDHIFTGRPKSSIVANVSRSVDPGSYANAARISGGVKHVTITEQIQIVNPDGSMTTQNVERTIDYPTTPVWAELPDIDLLAQGRWESSAGYPDIVEQAELDAKAAQRLAELAIVTPTYDVTLRDGTWGGPDHIWLGDTVRLIIKSGRLDEDLTLRVLGVDLTLGDSGEESVKLTVGTAPGSILRRIYEMERRLATLERR